MHQLIELIVRSLDDASRQGVLLKNGERLFPIPVGHKGDWPYLDTRWYVLHILLFFFLGPKHYTGSIEGAVNKSIFQCVIMCDPRPPAHDSKDRIVMSQKLQVLEGTVLACATCAAPADLAMIMKRCTSIGTQ